MERLKCAKCHREFYLNSGCSTCAPPPQGPHFCPECGGALHRTVPSYFISQDRWETD